MGKERKEEYWGRAKELGDGETEELEEMRR